MAIILLVKTLLFHLTWSGVFLVQTARSIKAKLSLFFIQSCKRTEGKEFFLEANLLTRPDHAPPDQREWLTCDVIITQCVGTRLSQRIEGTIRKRKRDKKNRGSLPFSLLLENRCFHSSCRTCCCGCYCCCCCLVLIWMEPCKAVLP